MREARNRQAAAVVCIEAARNPLLPFYYLFMRQWQAGPCSPTGLRNSHGYWLLTP